MVALGPSLGNPRVGLKANSALIVSSDTGRFKYMESTQPIEGKGVSNVTLAVSVPVFYLQSPRMGSDGRDRLEIWDADDSTPSGKRPDPILDSFKNSSRILWHYRGSDGMGIDFLWEPAAGHRYAAEIKCSVTNSRPGKGFPRTLRRPEGRKVVGLLPGAGPFCSPYA